MYSKNKHSQHSVNYFFDIFLKKSCISQFYLIHLGRVMSNSPPKTGGANLDSLNRYTVKMVYISKIEKPLFSKLLLSAKSSYIIIMIGPSSDFGSQPYFGYL